MVFGNRLDSAENQSVCKPAFVHRSTADEIGFFTPVRTVSAPKMADVVPWAIPTKPPMLDFPIFAISPKTTTLLYCKFKKC
jgi:hypothetical protein